MLTYADGSALSRYLAVDIESFDWLRWAQEHEDSIVTSPLGISELRRTADRFGPDTRRVAGNLAARLTVVRITDDALTPASMTTSVLSPFEAIHLGVAVTDDDVDTIATYERRLAQLARMYGLKVVTPGRDDGWWVD